MSGFDQSSIAVSMPTVVGSAAALAGPFKIKSSEAFSGALMTVSGLTGETISVQTSPDGYQGAPANPTFYRTDWQGTSLLYSTARTNNLLQSQGFSTASWTKRGTCAVTPNNIMAPDGTLTGSTISGLGAATVNDIFQVRAATNASRYEPSVWIYRIDTSGTLVLSSGISGGGSWNINLALLPAGWSRITRSHQAVTVSAEFIGVSLACGHQYACAAGSLSFGLWGAQLEPGTASTPYIPTTTTAVTVTDYTLSNGIITLAQAPITGATLSYDNGVLPSPYFVFATGNGTQTAFAYDGIWGTLTANSAKGNGIHQIDLRGAQAYQLVKSAGVETATVNMTLKRDALQYKNTAGTWSVT